MNATKYNTTITEQQAGAWDCVKWTSNGDAQAFPSSETGYYPIRKAAYDAQERTTRC